MFARSRSSRPTLIYRRGILELRSLTLDDELDATITLTTAHKAKGAGMGFRLPVRRLQRGPAGPDTDPGKRDDELNLIYVAVTRAMKILAINSLVLSIMQRYVDERKLKELVVR